MKKLFITLILTTSCVGSQIRNPAQSKTIETNCRKTNLAGAKEVKVKESFVLEGKKGGKIQKDLSANGKDYILRFSYIAKKSRDDFGGYDVTPLEGNQQIEIKKNDTLRVRWQQKSSAVELISDTDKVYKLQCFSCNSKDLQESDVKQDSILRTQHDVRRAISRNTRYVLECPPEYKKLLGGCRVRESEKEVPKDVNLDTRLRAELQKLTDDLKNERLKCSVNCPKEAEELLFNIEPVCDKIEVLPIKQEAPAEDNSPVEI